MAMTNPLQYIQQVRSEVAKVVWPTRREVMLTTVMVFIMAALTAVFFAMIDIIIRFGLTSVLATSVKPPAAVIRAACVKNHASP